MRRIRGVLAGAMGLLVLHALVARANQSQLSGLVGVITTMADRFLDPAVPAIPERGTADAASGGAAALRTATSIVSTTVPQPTTR